MFITDAEQLPEIRITLKGRCVGLRHRALGGEGSGNFGHAGRPGEVGGSAPGDGGGMLDRPTSHFTPSNPSGRDTRERFSDGHGHYTPERQALHDEIVAKYLRGTTPVERPVAMVLGGGMGSGKSTLVKSEGLAAGNTVQVNVDLIRSDLPEVKDMIAAGEKMNVALAHEEASDIGKQLMTQALKDSRNMTLDGTGDTTLEKLGGKTALMHASGHEVVAEYVTLPIKMAQERADERARMTDRRFVPPAAMKAVHEEVSRIFPEAVRQGMFDRARLWDTRGPRGSRPTLVMSAVGKEITVHDQALWEEFLVKGHLGH